MRLNPHQTQRFPFMEDLISPVIRLDLCILWEKKVFSLRRLIICLNIVSKLSEMSVCVCVCVCVCLLTCSVMTTSLQPHGL